MTDADLAHDIMAIHAKVADLEQRLKDAEIQLGHLVRGELDAFAQKPRLHDHSLTLQPYKAPHG